HREATSRAAAAAESRRGLLSGDIRLLFAGVASLVALAGAAQVASAATVTSVTPAEGCPGDVVTFHGTGFKTSPGSRPNGIWNDETGIREQFGPYNAPDLTERVHTDALETKVSTAQ